MFSFLAALDNEMGGISDKNTFNDHRIIGHDPLVQPALLRHEMPLSKESLRTVSETRVAAAGIINGDDDRLLVVVGPCSIHDVEQGVEYAKKLKDITPKLKNLVVVMRAYFEKPRTTVGWKGLINDPDIDGSFKINKGLRLGRQFLLQVTEIGVPVGSELLDTISPQYISDCISWGAIGARTTESQLHRELSSGVSFPIGFKNGTDGSVTVAIDAMSSACHPHAFMGVTEQGMASIVKTRGNDDVHVILRGGSKGPNYESEHVKEASEKIKGKMNRRLGSIMVDCSHGNSQKNYKNQSQVLQNVCAQIATGETNIIGVMIESHLNEGRQDIPESEGRDALQWGVSITDACVGWDETVEMLNSLDKAVGERREA